MPSPYDNHDRSEWETITEQLIQEHPLSEQEIIDIVLTAWNGIFETKLANELLIGKDIYLKPQEIGSFLHALIPYFLEKKRPKQWRRDQTGTEKDIVCLFNANYSIEIKTSSSKNRIYANRSYAQDPTNEKKVKSGYYLAVNFNNEPDNQQIRLIRFGWIDAQDWQGQRSPNGQQSHLEARLERLKLKTIYQSNAN